MLGGDWMVGWNFYPDIIRVNFYVLWVTIKHGAYYSGKRKIIFREYAIQYSIILCFTYINISMPVYPIRITTIYFKNSIICVLNVQNECISFV